MDSLNNINLNGNKITEVGGITGGDASPSKVFYADGSIKSPLSYELAVASEDGGNDTGSAGLMSPADKYNLDKLVDNNGQYELPIASSSKLGGIKVGSNLSINSSTGVLSATNTKYSQGNSNTLGLTRLYTSTGSNTNGTMTQKAVTEELIPLTNLRRWVEEATSLHLHNLIISKVQSSYWKDNLHFIQRSTLEGDYELNLITLFSSLNSYTGHNMDYRKDREWTWTILYAGKNLSTFNIIGQKVYATHGIVAGDAAVLRFVYKTADDNHQAALVCEATVGTWSCSCFVE